MKLVRRIGTRGRVSIPVEQLNRLGVSIGDELIVKTTKNGYIVKELPSCYDREDVVGRGNVVSVVTVNSNGNAQVTVPNLEDCWQVKLIQRDDRITITPAD